MTEYAAGKKGWRISQAPSRYPLTPQQIRLKEVIKECGIQKGISKPELQKLMVECIGPKMRLLKKEKTADNL